MKIKAIIVAALCICSAQVASATTLSMNITANTRVWAYISTDDSVQGTLFGEKIDDNWAWKSTMSVDLIPGVTNYLHLAMWTWGYEPGLLGEFTLSDPSYQFANDAQYITTNAVDWRTSMVGWNTYETPSIKGINDGTCPIFGEYRPGPVPDIAQSAAWIKTATFSEYEWFSTTISPNGSVTGTISLSDFFGKSALAPVQVDVMKPGTSEVVYTKTFYPGNSGSYTIDQMATGNFDIAFSACTWLRKVINVDVPSGTPAVVNVTLTAGDVDGDNEITSTDLSILGLGLGIAGD